MVALKGTPGLWDSNEAPAKPSSSREETSSGSGEGTAFQAGVAAQATVAWAEPGAPLARSRGHWARRMGTRPLAGAMPLGGTSRLLLLTLAPDTSLRVPSGPDTCSLRLSWFLLSDARALHGRRKAQGLTTPQEPAFGAGPATHRPSSGCILSGHSVILVSCHLLDRHQHPRLSRLSGQTQPGSL